VASRMRFHLTSLLGGMIVVSIFLWLSTRVRDCPLPSNESPDAVYLDKKRGWPFTFQEWCSFDKRFPDEWSEGLLLADGIIFILATGSTVSAIERAMWQCSKSSRSTDRISDSEEANAGFDV
jgi:hypothetical protein